jgi:hypothetical protein
MGAGLFWLSGFMLHDSLTRFAGMTFPTGEFLVPGILFAAGLIPAVIIIRDLVPGLLENPSRHMHTILRVLFFAAFLIVLGSSFLY